MNKFMTLEERISRLEKRMNERSVNRTGEPSNAFAVWKFLMDNGPSDSATIKDSFPPAKRATIASTLTNALKEDCIRKQGNLFVANPKYSWDDIGIFGGMSAVSTPKAKSSVRVRSAGKIVEPVVDDVEEPVVAPKKIVPAKPVIQNTPTVPKTGNRFTASNAVKSIIKNLGTAKQKSNLLEQIDIGFNATEALDELPKKKRDAMAAEFNSTYEKLRSAIVTFGVDKFTKMLEAELKRQGVRVTQRYDVPDERDEWDDYSGGEGYDNKSFDYYNDDDLRW